MNDLALRTKEYLINIAKEQFGYSCNPIHKDENGDIIVNPYLILFDGEIDCLDLVKFITTNSTTENEE